MSSNVREQQLTCVKCGGSMQQGFVIDCTYGGNVVSQWAPGAPQLSFFGRLNLSSIKRPRGTLPLAAFRCETCGFVEYYAGVQFDAK